MDKFEEMKTFVFIVDTGGITHAANKLNIAKSAVSRRLNDLESRLHIQLFNRSTRKLSLTDLGKSYYEQCLRLLNDLNEVESSITSENTKLTGKLRIAAPLSFGVGHLGKVIKAFATEHPDIQIELNLDDRKVNLIEEHYDIALRIGVLADSQLIARKLFKLNLMPVASTEFIKEYGLPKTPHDLDNLPMIDYMLRTNQFQFTDIKGASGKINPKIIHTCSNGDFIAELVANGLGFCLSPSFITYKHIENGNLIPLLQGYSWGEQNAYAVYPSKRHLSRRVQTFINFLIECFKGKPYWDKYI